MPAIKRTIPRSTVGGATPAPSSVPAKVGGIRKREAPELTVPKLILIPGTLGKVINSFNEAAGLAAPFILGNAPKFSAGRVTTGILSVDLGLGGGWKLSSAGMLYGEKSAGKTTLALRTVARVQRMFPDMFVVWIDIEGTLDRLWAVKQGVDLSRLVIDEPDSGEDAVNHMDAVLRSPECAMVVNDSIAMLTPQKEIDGVAEDELPGLQARLVTKALRKANNAVIMERKRRHYPFVCHINQFRMKIMAFGDPRSLPGGKALEFSTTQQLEVKNKESISTKGETKGMVMFNEHAVNVTKNKAGGPIKECAFKMIRTPHDDLDEGWIDQSKTISVLGLKTGIFTGVPASYEMEGVGKWRGEAAYNAWAKENQDKDEIVRQAIIDYYVDSWGVTP